MIFPEATICRRSQGVGTGISSGVFSGVNADAFSWKRGSAGSEPAAFFYYSTPGLRYPCGLQQQLPDFSDAGVVF
ncbi:MAG: hypothetical protein IPM36_20775 [Lewinellaceae bacterium]|nr:hypothetical protein [Lewinellaceae bacterium]